MSLKEYIRCYVPRPVQEDALAKLKALEAELQITEQNWVDAQEALGEAEARAERLEAELAALKDIEATAKRWEEEAAQRKAQMQADYEAFELDLDKKWRRW